jgi:hypothetical protein
MEFYGKIQTVKGCLGVNLNRIKDPGAEALLINDIFCPIRDWLWIFKNYHLTSQLGWLESDRPGHE